MQTLMVDFIISLDGYGAAEGWPGYWGQRHEHSRERGVVGGLRPGDAFDRAVAELLASAPARQPLLGRVRKERRDLGAAGRR